MAGSKQWISEAISRLLIQEEGKIYSRLETIDVDLDIDGTKAKGYCYCVKLDGNGNPRMEDLVEFVLDKIVDYSLPKKRLDDAREELEKTGSSSSYIKLERQAKKLFTDLSKTGEFGEMLLYILVQEILGLPQLISKMTLKTSGNLHYQGADGIHVKYSDEEETLSLYWGESKMEKSLYSAIKNCFDSLKCFLLDPITDESVRERDLQLISSNLLDNINDPKLEEVIVRYFNLDDDLSNKLNYKGVCFVGFDVDNYPNKPMHKITEQLVEEFKKDVSLWLDKASYRIKSHVDLEKFEIHLFLIPFPSVQAFRDHFLKVLGK